VNEDEEILREFLEEGRECLEGIELGLVALEAMPDDAQLIAQVYRGLHKVKGTSSLLGFRELEMLTHRGEDVLDALRAGRITMTAMVTATLLALADELRGRLDVIERDGADVAPADLALLAGLGAHAGGDDGRIVAPPSSAGPAAEPAATVAPQTHLDPQPETRLAPLPPAADVSIRVDPQTLDTLMALAGELVLLRGRLAELTAGESGGELVNTYRQLRRATDELLGTVRQARLQPIGTILRRYPRVVRDLARELGKDVTVVLGGEEVGADRAINEALSEALLHLVRNAVDHGLETAAERVTLGKGPTGTLTIAASQERGRVCVEITDDGRGIDVAAVVEHAVAAGAVAREDVASLSEDERRQLIFLPGLSTRREAGVISGRGVGMDAVRVDLARVGGTIEVHSAVGRGTTFRIDVPLTLAIVPCLLVEAAARRYCVPQTAIREVVALAASDVAEVGGAPLLRRRDGLIPLVDLAGTLATVSDATAPEDERSAVIVESERGRFGIIVESVGNPIEAVVKPLPPSVRSARVFSGVSILADGSPTLILDLDAIAAHVGLATPAAVGWEASIAEVTPPEAEWVELLIARAGGRRLAVPAASVRRLELADAERLRRGSGRELLDEGPTLLTLVRLDGARSSGELDVIVCDCPGGEVGLVVDAIEDIVNGEVVTEPRDGAPGLVRLQRDGDVADLLDLAGWTPLAEVAS
jgi:two-component system chemotaxis sensor kinase CheA